MSNCVLYENFIFLSSVEDTYQNRQNCGKEYLSALHAIWRHDKEWRQYVIVCSSFLCIEAMGKCDDNLCHLKCIIAGACGQYYEEIFGNILITPPCA
jgi:hypothetical protein